MRASCPACGRPLEPEDEAGEAACPHCGAALPVEAIGETAGLPPPTDEAIEDHGSTAARLASGTVPAPEARAKAGGDETKGQFSRLARRFGYEPWQAAAILPAFFYVPAVLAYYLRLSSTGALIAYGCAFVLLVLVTCHKKSVSARRAFVSARIALQKSGVVDMRGTDFEKYVCLLLKLRGSSVDHTGGPGDQGVDIIATVDALKHAVQCKGQEGPVGSPEILKTLGGMLAKHCDRAMVVTNSYFTEQAKVAAKAAGNCVLVDRDELARWAWEIADKEESQGEAGRGPPSMA